MLLEYIKLKLLASKPLEGNSILSDHRVYMGVSQVITKLCNENIVYEKQINCLSFSC